jgi:hypothetical protein
MQIESIGSVAFYRRVSFAQQFRAQSGKLGATEGGSGEQGQREDRPEGYPAAVVGAQLEDEAERWDGLA